MNKTDWQRRNALFDELVEVPEVERAAWLAQLEITEPEHVPALKKMLLQYMRDTAEKPSTTTPQPHALSLAGVGARDFEAQLEAATEQGQNAPSSVQAGDDIGPWQLERKIGEGGMGAVWLAKRRDGHFEGHAAIKFLRTGLTKTELIERFLRERRLLARLTHPGIARLLDAGSYRDEPYLVMEYIDGLPVTDWASRHATHVADRIALMLKVCRATEHAHGQLIVHRDLKPSNVLVSKWGEPSLLDFGIAKLIDDDDEDYGTALTRMTGRGYTLGYCAPEQITGEPTGVAADVFSLGVLLFELLTGTLPFRPEAGREGRAALEHAIVHGEAKTIGRALDEADPSVRKKRPVDAFKARGDLDAIVAKTLRKNPQDRYATVSALASDLDAWLSGKPISIRAEDRSYRSRLWLKRNWLVATLGSVAAIAIVAGLAISLWQREEAVNAAKLAREEAARASKVADYLGELIQSASPDNHAGKWPTVLALLEKSEKDLDKQFADDPKTHVVLLKKLVATNDALNRHAIALTQLTQLIELLKKTQHVDSDEMLQAQKHQAQLLRRMSRHSEAMEIDEALLPKFAARYGKNSEQYGKLLMDTHDDFAKMGRMQEARQRLVDGAAIIIKLKPDDIAKRIDLVNDTAVLFTRQRMWRESMETLASVEAEFPTLARLGGQHLRDSFILRRNLEAIRIRLGMYDGVEDRLKKIIVDADALLGEGNVQSGKVRGFLHSLACETGRFDECLRLTEALAKTSERRKADDPEAATTSALQLLAGQLRAGRVPDPPASIQLQKLLAEIDVSRMQEGAQLADSYRFFSDVAADADMVALAEEAQQRARATLAKINNTDPERAAQVERATAATTWLRGDAKRAVQLLAPSFKQQEISSEGDSPRRASLWLQRALYEVEYDTKAAAASIAECRAIYKRIGTVAPHFMALMGYVDARIDGNANAVRAAEDAVDRAWSRPRRSPWRMPLLSSL